MKEFDKVVERVVAQAVGSVERPPKDFSKGYDASAGGAAAGVTGVVGATILSHTGLAFLGTAISGAWLAIPLAGLAAWVAGNWSNRDE